MAFSFLFFYPSVKPGDEKMSKSLIRLVETFIATQAVKGRGDKGERTKRWRIVEDGTRQ